MRSVLALAVVLLALVLAIENERVLFPRPPARGADRALEIVAGAKGPLLPAARLGDGPETIGEVIRLGERTLAGPGDLDGLRAALLGPGGELEREGSYASDSSMDAHALGVLAAEADEGSVLVLASSGRLEPAGPDAQAAQSEREAALAELGARARPGRTTPESWALIAARLEHGWVPLAESYAKDAGVAVAFVLPPDLELAAGFRGDFARVAAPERYEVFLDEELARARERTRGVESTRHAAVLDRVLPALVIPPVIGPDGAATAGRVRWEDVALGPGSGLLAWVGLADGQSAGSDGVVFEVRIDGERAHTQIVPPGAPWKLVQVDLRAFAGRKVALELAVDPRASGTGDAALWGRPMLVHGYDRSPIEVWAGPR